MSTMKNLPPHRTVLVIEDDDDVLGLIADVLRERGHTVHCARDGTHALAHLGETGFELILLDLTLPDMSGLEFLDRRERIPQLAGSRVVILSGAEDAFALGEARRFPVLRKPFRASELVNLVEVEMEASG
jgi:DNA-binding response OmpR family regulator